MLSTTDDLRILDLAELETPHALQQALPAIPAIASTVAKARHAIREILAGRDDRIIVVIGPCSIHDPVAARDYARRLAAQRRIFGDALEIVMRVYFEKPRTTIGWKGLINDPYLDGSFQIGDGLRLARQLLLDINALGLPAGCEFLDIMIPQYVTDLVSWGAIGARTTESQVHREMASGLSCAIGFKNGTSGDVAIAIDAVKAASHAHHFLAVSKSGRAAIARTTGNQDCHIILRGGEQPNYDAASVDAAVRQLFQAGLSPRVMIDASHANSGKNPERQPMVIDNIAGQIANGDPRIIGVMIESNLTGGRQNLSSGTPLKYGQSITDGCIDWPSSIEALAILAAALRERRRSAEHDMLRLNQKTAAAF